MISKEEIKNYQVKLSRKSPEEIIKWAIDFFGVENIALASSLGAEDQVLTDMILKINPRVQISTLDTGRLPQETYDTIEKTMKHYNMKYEILFPKADDVEKMEEEYGPDLFFESIKNRKKCCGIRKVEPLKKKLATLKAWICGLRRGQAVTRKDIEKIEWDDTFRLVKLNPLADWNEEQIWKYIKEYNVPYNKLHDKGYPSIGCAPCTRAIKPGEDIRRGRWWWEESIQKECGLHR